MTIAPKFSPIVTEFTDEQITAAERKVSRFYGPGTYDVTIQQIAFKRLLEKDNDWGVFEMVLGDGARSMRNWVCVPFKDIVYKSPGTKNPFGMYYLLRTFFAALGEDLHKGNLKIISDYFAGNNCQKLVGKKLNVVVGYKSDHVGFNTETKKFFLAREDGKPRVIGGKAPEFAKRDEAAAHAAEQRIVLQDFPEILSLTPALKGPADDNAADEAGDAEWDS